jgi:assimilatory nitrate reductase catalytic subunit
MLFGRRRKNPIKLPDKGVKEWKYATCGYCSTGCAMEVGLDAHGEAVTTRGVADAPVNRGKLCIKGITEAGIFNATGRGTEPLLRRNYWDDWKTVGWDEALDHTAAHFKRIQQQYGPDSVAIVSTGQIMTEEFYTLGKVARGVIGTNNYCGNTTLCMASAVSGYKRSFGADGPPGCYDDFEHTHCLLAVGSNLPEQHPVIYWRLKEALEKRKFPVIVVDPRVTMFAQFADIHLPIVSGTDLVLLNALAHVILDEGLADEAYIAAHCNGRDEFQALVSRYDPLTASKICGINEDMIRQVARLYAQADAAMSIWTMGINQSTHGSDGVSAINNLNLITGNIGKPGGTSLSITGQCNAMGTREWGSTTGLPGYRSLENPQHRAEIAAAWNIDEARFPASRGLSMTDIFPAIESGQVKALWLIATNPMTSMPNTARIRRTMEKLEFCVVQDSYADVEANQYAHVFFPGAIWAEKEGTFTNTERRVNLVTSVKPPLANSKPDLWIFTELAKRWEHSAVMPFPTTSSDVFEEMKMLSVGIDENGAPRNLDLSGMSHAKILAARGLQWPMRAGDDKGQDRLYTDGVFPYPDGKARLLAMEWHDNNETPDDDFPFWLNTGRVVEHFHTRTRTGKVGNCNKFSPTPYMEMNPDAATRLDISHMEYVRLVSRRGDAIVMVQMTHRVPHDMVFVPFHYHDCVNRLSLGLLDPRSRQPAFKQCAVRIEKTNQADAAQLNLEMRAY